MYIISSNKYIIYTDINIDCLLTSACGFHIILEKYNVLGTLLSLSPKLVLANYVTFTDYFKKPRQKQNHGKTENLPCSFQTE